MIETEKRLKLPISSLHLGFIGGAPAAPELFKQIRNVLDFDTIMVNTILAAKLSSFSIVYHLHHSRCRYSSIACSLILAECKLNAINSELSVLVESTFACRVCMGSRSVQV